MLSVKLNTLKPPSFRSDPAKEPAGNSVSKDDGYEWLDVKPEKMSFKKESMGLLAGVMCFLGVKQAVKKFQGLLVDRLFKNVDDIPKDKTKSAIDEMVQTSGLDKKGFRLEFIEEGDEERLHKALMSDLEESKLYGFYKKIKLNDPIKRLYQRQIRGALSATAKGQNAFYSPISNMAIMNKNITATALHEIGHAINFNKSFKYLRMFAYALPITMLAFVGVYPLEKFAFNFSKKSYLWSKDKMIKEKENNDAKIKNGELTEQEIKIIKNAENINKKMLKFTNSMTKFNEKCEKGYDWIKDNAGKLMLLSFIPVLLEEGSASMHGINAAKSKFTPEELLKLKKGYGNAFLTYVVGALTVSAAVRLGVYVRDKIVESPDKVKNSAVSS